MSIPRNVAGLLLLGSLVPTAVAQTGDFNGDLVYDCHDMELLQFAQRENSNDPRFMGYSQDSWREEASEALGYEVSEGDINMDGAVDFSDIVVLGINWQMGSETMGWCRGDIDNTGYVDSADSAWPRLRWQSNVLPRANANVEALVLPSPQEAWAGGFVFGRTDQFDLIAVPQVAPDGYLATMVAAQMKDPNHRFVAVDHVTISGDLHQAWLDHPFAPIDGNARERPLAGPTYLEEWIPYDSHLLVTPDVIAFGAGGAYHGVHDTNDGSDPAGKQEELPTVFDDVGAVLGIGPIEMTHPTDIFMFAPLFQSSFRELAYVVTPAIMPDSNEPGAVGLMIGLHGADGDDMSLPNVGVVGLEEPFPIPFLARLCDFDADGYCAAADLDNLIAAAGTGQSEFDLNGDGSVDQLDIDEWLDVGGRDQQVFVRGDADLDGDVDAADLNRLAQQWQIPGDYGWAGGDFDGNGVADPADLNVLGINWQHGVSQPGLAVPEASPSCRTLIALILASLGRLHLSSRKRRSRNAAR